MKHASLIVAGIALMYTSGAVAVTDQARQKLNESDVAFLWELTGAVVQESRVVPGAKVGKYGPNTTGGILIRPGGRDCYPAFWIRDYTMSLDCGRISVEEQKHALLLTAANQQDTEWRLPSGSVVTPGSIPDHITFGGKPIYYPGTLDDYDGQGGPRWGKLPCLDDHFYFIHMAAKYVETSGDKEILRQIIKGKTLAARLEDAFAMPPSRPDTGLVYADAEARGVTFGFVDAIVHTGDLLFCSLLKMQAADELSWLLESSADPSHARRYHAISDRLRKAIPKTFASKDGLLRASTGASGQPDVWGSAYAVYIGALDRKHESQVCRELAWAYRNGVLAWKGNIRHVLTKDDFSKTTAWENTDVKVNQYQNGAYWGTPTGWVAYAIAKAEPESAVKLMTEYVAELREGDFRKGPDFGSPWECMHPDGAYRQNAVYMTSVTCPAAALNRLNAELSGTKIKRGAGKH